MSFLAVDPEAQIRKCSQRLAEQTLRAAQARKAQNSMSRSIVRVAQEKLTQARAGTIARDARVAGAGIPIVFAVWDIIDPVGEYNSTVSAVR